MLTHLFNPPVSEKSYQLQRKFLIEFVWVVMAERVGSLEGGGKEEGVLEDSLRSILDVSRFLLILSDYLGWLFQMTWAFYGIIWAILPLPPPITFDLLGFFQILELSTGSRSHIGNPWQDAPRCLHSKWLIKESRILRSIWGFWGPRIPMGSRYDSSEIPIGPFFPTNFFFLTISPSSSSSKASKASSTSTTSSSSSSSSSSVLTCQKLCPLPPSLEWKLVVKNPKEK